MESKWDPILKAAKGLFFQRGIAATSMEEIAVEAGTTKRTVYNNFGSKERLVEAVFREAGADFKAAVPELSLNAGKEELAAYGHFAVFCLTEEYAIGFQRIMIAESANLGPVGTALQTSAMEALRAPLEMWLMENRGLKPSQVKNQAAEIMGRLSAEARLDRLTGARQPYAFSDDPNHMPELDPKDLAAVGRFLEELAVQA